MLAANTVLQNRYRVVRELGHGGMGTVYEALDQRVNCIIALKEASVEKNDESRSAFEREAALLANLRHPALPKVMDYFSEGAGDFLVMEFIPGHDLAELLELRGSPFPEAQVLRWADDLLRVLEYLHRQRPPILHRDIKPSNLKLTKQGEIFLLDFGLAKGAAGQMHTLVTSRSVRGYTPVYSSLEQIHGHGTDPRSDLYSLSGTLYHLLTGVPPGDAPTRFNLMEDEQPDPLQPIEKLNPQCSSRVAAIIHQGMAINRRHRPAGAAEMRKALRRAVEPGESEVPSGEDWEGKRQRHGFTDEPTLFPRDRAPGKRTGLIVAAALTGIAVVALIVWVIPGTPTTQRVVESQPSRSVQEVKQIPEPQPPVGMVYVPGGTLLMGRNEGVDQAERPAHRVTVAAFYIDRYEVTNEDYEKFVVATGQSAPMTWAAGMYPTNAARKPVTGVEWDDANAYASWAGKRLPTEVEWEFAARGTDGRLYPWGNEWGIGSANADGARGGTMDVGSFKAASPFDAFDMVGNAWEWTASDLRAYPGGTLPANLPAGDLKVIRGGSYESTKDYATATYRTGWPARDASTYAQTGFRCAKDIEP